MNEITQQTLNKGSKKAINPKDLWVNQHIAIYRWVILMVTTFTQATIALISQGMGTLGPFLVTDLGLSKTQLGFIGGAVNVGMTLTALLAGRAVDVWGEKKVLVLGGLTTGGAILLTSFAHSFVTLVGFLLLTGLWAATSTPAGSKAIMTWFPYSQRAMALGIRQTGIPLGGMIAALMIPPIAMNFGWQMAMITMSIGAVLGAGVCQFTYKDYPLAEEKKKVKQTQRWTELLRDRNIWLVGITGMTYVSAQFTIVTYLVLYLHDKTHLSIAVASLFLALVQFGGMAGRIFWGYVSDHFFHGQRKPVLGLIGIIAAGMALVMLTLSEANSPWFIALATWFFGFTAIGWNGIFVTLLSEIAGKEQAGTAVGMGLTLLQIGVLIFPPTFGLLVDSTGSYQAGWIGLSMLMLIGVLVLTRVKDHFSD